LFCLRQSLLHAPEVIKPAASNLSLECAMRIYVGNLSFETEEQQLEQLFAAIGEVASVRLIRDQATGRSRGFGFVEMTNDEQARAACDTLNESEFGGRRLTVNEAKPQERNSGGFSGRGGRQRRESRW
jgi:cold-inducible RNA-binding protein